MQLFKENMMIVNPDKFQAIIIDRKNQQNNPTSTKLNDININSENSVRLLGLEIYHNYYIIIINYKHINYEKDVPVS